MKGVSVPHLVIFDGCLSVSFLYSYHKFILVVMTWRSSLPVPQETQAVRVSGWVFDVTRVWVGINASYGKVEKFKNLYNYIIGLHAVQFGNNWMRKIRRTAKLDKAVGRVQFVSQRNFSNSIIFKLASRKNIEPCWRALLSVLSQSTSDISGNLLVSTSSSKYSSNMPHETSNSPRNKLFIYTFALCEDRYALIGSIFISLFFMRFHWLRTSCPNYLVSPSFPREKQSV